MPMPQKELAKRYLKELRAAVRELSKHIDKDLPFCAWSDCGSAQVWLDGIRSITADASPPELMERMQR